jgi:hypothetical protein
MEAQVQFCTAAEQTDALQSLSSHDCINTWQAKLCSMWSMEMGTVGKCPEEAVVRDSSKHCLGALAMAPGPVLLPVDRSCDAGASAASRLSAPSVVPAGLCFVLFLSIHHSFSTPET